MTRNALRAHRNPSPKRGAEGTETATLRVSKTRRVTAQLDGGFGRFWAFTLRAPRPSAFYETRRVATQLRHAFIHFHSPPSAIADSTLPPSALPLGGAGGGGCVTAGDKRSNNEAAEPTHSSPLLGR